MNIRERIEGLFPDVPLLFIDPPDTFDLCIVGVAERFGGFLAVAYDYDSVIDALMEDGMSNAEAEEFFDYNILARYVGDCTPVFIRNSDME